MTNQQPNPTINIGNNVEEYDFEEEKLIPRPKQIYGSFYIRMGAVRE